MFRFIPAGAGNGTISAPWRSRSSVHPRGCGERSFRNFPENVRAGSSPRVRGTVIARNLQGKNSRFIPAGAGNGQLEELKHIMGSVHPRGCGERKPAEFDECINYGSSPRVRGTVVHLMFGNIIKRFIPAGAGNGGRICRRGRAWSVHPRGCGERSVVVGRAEGPSGSSPRVRGTGFCSYSFPLCYRFIPAGAGNG